MTTTTREESLKAALEALSGNQTPADALLGRLCEMRRECPAKWDRFKDSAQTNMGLTTEKLAAIVTYVEGR